MAKMRISLTVELIPERKKEDRELNNRPTTRVVTYDTPTSDKYVNNVDKLIEFLEGDENAVKINEEV